MAYMAALGGVVTNVEVVLQMCLTCSTDLPTSTGIMGRIRTKVSGKYLDSILPREPRQAFREVKPVHSAGRQAPLHLIVLVFKYLRSRAGP